MKDYEKYIYDVENNNIITNEYIKLVVARFEEMKQRDDIYFDKKQVEHVINFISNIKHYLGKFNGQPFILEPFQSFIIAYTFGFKWKKNNKRVIKTIFALMARKSGKSAFSAAIMLYLLIADNEASPELIFAANSRQQAKILLDIATQFTKSLDPKAKYLKPFRNEIRYKKNNGTLKIVSADSSKLDGLNLHSFCIDEFHEAKNYDMLNVLQSSQGMREQPLNIIISTAGYNLDSPCKKMYDTSIEVLKKLKDDDTLLPVLYTLDEEDLKDWENPVNWIKSNPNINVTVTDDYIKDEITKAKNNPSLETGVKTKNLNLWCYSKETWIAEKLIIDSSKDINIEDYRGYNCTIGVDLSMINDLTAVSVLIYKDNKYIFKNYYYLPESALTEHKNRDYYLRIYQQKNLILTSGNVVDYDYIMNDIMKIGKTLNIEAVYYDSWNSTQFAINCTENGINMQPYSQSIANFNRPTKEFQRLILGNNVIIDNNELTRFCFKNVALKFDHNNNCKPVKSNSDSQKIDGVIAMLTALGGYLLTPRYEDNTIYIL